MPPRAKKQAEPVEEYDPFAPKSDEPDEAQTELSPPWDEDNETDVNAGANSPTDTNKKRQVINVGSEGKVVVTLKGGRDFDEPWVVIHADDLDDALKQTTDREKLGDLLKAAQEASKAFREFGKGNSPAPAQNASQGGSQQRSQGRPSNAVEHPKGRKEFCEHGEMEFKSGMGKNNKMWGAFDCKVDPKGCAKGRVWDNDFGK